MDSDLRPPGLDDSSAKGAPRAQGNPRPPPGLESMPATKEGGSPRRQIPQQPTAKQVAGGAPPSGPRQMQVPPNLGMTGQPPPRGAPSQSGPSVPLAPGGWGGSAMPPSGAAPQPVSPSSRWPGEAAAAPAWPGSAGRAAPPQWAHNAGPHGGSTIGAGAGVHASSSTMGSKAKEAAAAALRRFASAEEERRQGPTEGSLEADYERRRRKDAEAKAEATAARLKEQASGGAAVGPTSGDSATATEAGATVEVQDKLIAGASTQVPAEKRYLGKIKAFDSVQGFGFVQSAEILKQYGCDAFLNHAVEGGVVIGGTVTFAVELNKAGKPQARRVKLEETAKSDDKTATKAPQIGGGAGGNLGGLVGQVYRGRVKSFNAARGFGFVVCHEVQLLFGGRDIYADRAQAPDGRLSVGQEVDFRLAVDRQGQPQARDIRSIGPRGAPADNVAPPDVAAVGWKLFG